VKNKLTIVVVCTISVCVACGRVEYHDAVPPRLVNILIQNATSSEIICSDGESVRAAIGPGVSRTISRPTTSKDASKPLVVATPFPKSENKYRYTIVSLPGDENVAVVVGSAAGERAVEAVPPQPLSEMNAQVCTLLGSALSDRAKTEFGRPIRWADKAPTIHDEPTLEFGQGPAVVVQTAAVAYLTTGSGLLFRWLPSGTFITGVRGAGSRSISLTSGLWMAITEVTVGEASMADNPADRKLATADRPLGGLSWDTANQFVVNLSKKQGDMALRMPTEAEWEYAAQAGSTRPFGSRLGPEELTWHAGNAGGKAHVVGTKASNDWGLFDIHGNMSEFCQSWFSFTPPSGIDPIGPAKGQERVRRGRSFACPLSWCTSGLRDSSPPDIVQPWHGVRLVAVFPAPGAFSFPLNQVTPDK